MLMKSWVACALASMVFAGVTSVIAKMGLNGISGELGLTVRTVIVFVLVIPFALLAIPSSQWSALTRENYLWLGISAVTTFLSWLFYYKALKEGEVSTIAIIDKGSMIVAVILAFFLLKEQITWRTVAGASLMIAGLFVIAKK